MLKTRVRFPAVFIITFCLLLQFPVFISNGKSSVVGKCSINTIKNTYEVCSGFTLEVDSLYQNMNLAAAGLSKNVFQLALKGYKKLKSISEISRDGILSIVDFSKPSDKKRFYILDLKAREILLNTLVAHGRNSGMTYANSFSNKPSSNKSSLGFYKTLNSYWGEKGYALKLKGEEPGINDKAYARNIVVHGSDYADETFIRTTGHLGRSQGCPAVPEKESKKVIDYIKNGSCLFIYHPSRQYLKKSRLVNS